MVVAFAGGPGQSATAAFRGYALDRLGELLETHDLVVFDQRGTGRSGLLRCRGLERASLLRAGGPAGQCAAALGPGRAFYTSRDTADDLSDPRAAERAHAVALRRVLRAATPVPGRGDSALRGDPALMLRLKRRAIGLESDVPDPREFSTALYAATTCEEVALPWPRGTPFAVRRAKAGEAVSALTDAQIRPFDRATVLGSDVIDLCTRWPEARDAPPPRDPVRFPAYLLCWSREATTCALLWSPPGRWPTSFRTPRW